MSVLYDLGYWISTLMLMGDRLNILGFIWLISLGFITFYHSRFYYHFHIAWKSSKYRVLKLLRLLITCFIPVILFHFITDELFTFLVFGFGRFPPGFGLLELWNMKYQVYLSSVILFLIGSDFLRMFKLSKKAILFIMLLLAADLIAAYFHVGDFAANQGWERFWRFWLFYPTTKTCSALVYISLLRKHSPGRKDPPLEARLQSVLVAVMDSGRYFVMRKLSSSRRFGLNIGCGSTRYLNKINVDVSRKADVDVLADARALPFRDSCFQEVVMDQVLEHIPQDLEALKEVRRVLVHDAVLLLSVPLKGFLARLDNLWMHRNEYHASYTFKQLSMLFLTLRFQVIAEFPYGTFVHYLKLRSFAGTVFMIGRVKK